MNLFPILFFIIAITIIGYLMYKVGSTTFNSKEGTTLKPTSKILSPIFLINEKDYEDKQLLNVYYSIINDYNFNLDTIHSVDNGIFLEFSDNTWLNVMYNGNLEVYQIENSNPFELSLEYKIVNQNSSPNWKPFIYQNVSTLDVKTIFINKLYLPKDLVLNFKSNKKLFICFSEETLEIRESINFGMQWLVIIFDLINYEKLRSF